MRQSSSARTPEKLLTHTTSKVRKRCDALDSCRPCSAPPLQGPHSEQVWPRRAHQCPCRLQQSLVRPRRTNQAEAHRQAARPSLLHRSQRQRHLRAPTSHTTTAPLGAAAPRALPVECGPSSKASLVPRCCPCCARWPTPMMHVRTQTRKARRGAPAAALPGRPRTSCSAASSATRPARRPACRAAARGPAPWAAPARRRGPARAAARPRWPRASAAPPPTPAFCWCCECTGGRQLGRTVWSRRNSAPGDEDRARAHLWRDARGHLKALLDARPERGLVLCAHPPRAGSAFGPTCCQSGLALRGMRTAAHL